MSSYKKKDTRSFVKNGFDGTPPFNTNTKLVLINVKTERSMYTHNIVEQSKKNGVCVTENLTYD